jgi:hypothetical protein
MTVKWIYFCQDIHFVVDQLTSHSTEHSPCWEAYSRTAVQEIIRLLWNPTVQFRVHMMPQLDLISNQMNSDPIILSYFFKINFRVIFQATHMATNWALTFRFPDQNFARISHLSHAPYIPRKSHSSWFDLLVTFDDEYKVTKLLITLLTPSSCHFLPLRSKYSPQRLVLKHKSG